MVLPAPTPPPCPFEKRFPSQLVRDDVFFMSLAYNQAIDAWRRDEVPIGCVIERDGEVLAMAHNTVEGAHDPTAHAEMLAITQAAAAIGDWRLENCTLYVTKEPCPMCSGATLMSRLRGRDQSQRTRTNKSPRRDRCRRRARGRMPRLAAGIFPS